MPSTNVFNKLYVKRSLLRSLPQQVIAVCNAVYFRFMHRFDAYSSTSYSRGIRWLPSPEVCRMPGSIEETESQSRGDENGRQTPPTSTSEPNSAGEKGTQDEEKLKDQQTRNIEPVKRY